MKGRSRRAGSVQIHHIHSMRLVEQSEIETLKLHPTLTQVAWYFVDWEKKKIANTAPVTLVMCLLACSSLHHMLHKQLPANPHHSCQLAPQDRKPNQCIWRPMWVVPRAQSNLHLVWDTHALWNSRYPQLRRGRIVHQNLRHNSSLPGMRYTCWRWSLEYRNQNHTSTLLVLLHCLHRSTVDMCFAGKYKGPANGKTPSFRSGL